MGPWQAAGQFEEVGVVYVRAYGWFVAALIWCVVLLVAAVRFT
jgi:ATP/ADP translocase